jgi:hypothetical protein
MREIERGFTIKSNGKSFTFRNGIESGCIWIECEDGEGGDFNQDALFETIRRFYDESF